MPRKVLKSNTLFMSICDETNFEILIQDLFEVENGLDFLEDATF